MNESSSPTLEQPNFGETSKEFHLAQVSPAEMEEEVAFVTTKRRDSAPDLNGTELADSRHRIIIRLTSVDGLEFSLSSPVEDNLLRPAALACPVWSTRVGAARQNSSKSLSA